MANTDDQQPDESSTTPGTDDVILSEETAIPRHRPAEPGSPHELLAAYMLDALSPEERTAFETHLAGCAECSQRLPELRRVADLLPNALIVPPSELPDAYPFLLRDVAHETLPVSSTLPGAFEDEDEDEPEPDAVTRETEAEPEPVNTGDAEADDEDEEEITLFADPAAIETDGDEPEPGDIADELDADAEPLDAAIADDELDADVDAAPEFDPDEDEPEPAAAAPVRQPRPPGRIRPGVRPPGGPALTVANRSVPFRATPAVIGFSLLGLVAVGLFLWALLLQGRINDLEGDIDRQNGEITNLRQNANATAYTLVPTADGPAAATGTFFFSLPDQRGALVVRGLAQPAQGQTYQIWYIDDNATDPIAGPAFAVNAQGEAAIPLNLNASTFNGVAISLEPAPGSDAPTNPYLLQGELGGAAG
jgi:hypothetical protein